jgi:phosphohistidine phosphatase
MKSVILIRHTKSDWSNLVEDFDRPIRQDRKEDAIHVAKEIEKKGKLPQYIVSSPALRTLQTAELVCSKWGYPFKNATIDKSLYECTAKEILLVIQNTEEKYDTIAIICHNPAITDLVNQYSDISIDNVPTSGAVQIDFDAEHWDRINEKGKAQWFLRPRKR